MNKVNILLLAEGKKVTETAFKYIESIFGVGNVHIQCFIPDSVAYEKQLDIKGYTKLSNSKENLAVFDTNKLVEEIENLESFIEAKCKKDNFIYSIHKWNLDVDELLDKALYYDVLMLSKSYHVENIESLKEDEKFHEIIYKTKTPVFLLPEHFEPINNVIFTFDGKENSVVAIKQFVHLFDKHITNKKFLVLHASTSFNLHIEQGKHLLKDYLEDKYNYVEMEELKGDAGTVLATIPEVYPNSIVVTGGMGRGKLSRMFKPSRTEALIQKNICPIFLAHL